MQTTVPGGEAQEYRAFVVERHGIDIIPEADRKMTVPGLFLMWSASMWNVENLVTGVIMIAIGLSFVQAMVILIIGNLSFFLAAAASLQGPRSGTSTFGVSRAVFGQRGGKGLAVISWVTMICYEIEGVALIGLAFIALGEQAGMSDSTGLKVGAVLVGMALQAVLPIFGHATMTRTLRLLAVPFLAVFILMTVLIVPKVHLSTISHGGSWATVFIGLTIAIASSGIGWVIQGNDYSRYLRSSTPPRKIIAAVTIGGGIPCLLLNILGAAVASAIKNASDPISGLPQVFPSWFLVPYLILAIPQVLALNSLNFYSSGLNIQAMGIRIPRLIATSIDCVLCAALSVVVILSNNFNSWLVDFEQLLILWVAPFTGVFLVDAWLRRNRYDSSSLLAGPGTIYWGSGGFRWPAVIAQLAGMTASAFCLNSSVFEGPISSAAHDADFSVLGGVLVAAVLYYVFGAAQVRKENQLLGVEEPPASTADLAASPA
jgi:nucleobase:cation symporter-1, NCS1 family